MKVGVADGKHTGLRDFPPSVNMTLKLHRLISENLKQRKHPITCTWEYLTFDLDVTEHRADGPNSGSNLAGVSPDMTFTDRLHDSTLQSGLERSLRYHTTAKNRREVEG